MSKTCTVWECQCVASNFNLLKSVRSKGYTFLNKFRYNNLNIKWNKKEDKFRNLSWFRDLTVSKSHTLFRREKEKSKDIKKRLHDICKMNKTKLI